MCCLDLRVEREREFRLLPVSGDDLLFVLFYLEGLHG